MSVGFISGFSSDFGAQGTLANSTAPHSQLTPVIKTELNREEPNQT